MKFSKPLIFSLCALLSFSANASQSYDTLQILSYVYKQENIQAQRDAYKNALDLIKQDKIAQAEQLQNGILKNYPLNIWLDYYKLRANINASKANKARDFILNSGHEQLSKTLRNNYIYYFYKNKNYKKTLEFFNLEKHKNVSLKGFSNSQVCMFYNAQFHTNKAKAQAISFAKNTYLQLNTLSSACNDLVKTFKQNGYIGANLKKQKLEKAYVSTRYKSVAKALLTQMSNSKYKTYAKTLMSYYDKPQNAISNLKVTEANKKIASLAMIRLANLDKDKALAVYDKYHKKFKPNKTELNDVKSVLASNLLNRDATLDEVNFADTLLNNKILNANLIEKRIRRAIWYGQWDIVYNYVKKIEKLQGSKINWQYWKGRSAMELGYKKEANEILNKVAKDRSFWGFYTAQSLNLPFEYNYLKLPENSDLNSLKNNMYALRFFELYIQKDPNADIEFKELIKNSSLNDCLLMAQWALENEEYYYAIDSVITAKRWDALDYRFPRPYQSLYKKFAQKNDVSMSFLYGISRQESMLNPKARSPVGALGLMQLMPSTAKYIAKQNKWRLANNRELLEPDTNIQYGSSYIRNMLDRFDDNRILASAAYNAGPNRINIWKSNDNLYRDAAMYVENIPFSETRNYVQNVLLYDCLYYYLINNKSAPLLLDKELDYKY